jgi:enterochelin esterase-like enzyme
VHPAVRSYTAALDAEPPYFIDLPPDYDTAVRVYSSLDLLHDASAPSEQWLAYGFVDVVEQMIVATEIQPPIVGLPRGDFGYWVNHVGGGLRWADFTVQDLVHQVDATYRTGLRSIRRGVGGLSIGSHGALALTHPDVFGVVGEASPSLREDAEAIPVLGDGVEGEVRDPLALAHTAPGIETLTIYLDIGTADIYFPRAERQRDALRARGVELPWRAQEGRDHSGWVDYDQDYVRFYDFALNAR